MSKKYKNNHTINEIQRKIAIIDSMCETLQNELGTLKDPAYQELTTLKFELIKEKNKINAQVF